MTYIGIFIDGPLAGEMREVSNPHTWSHAMPARVTICDCDPKDAPLESEIGAGVVVYHSVMIQPRGRIVLFSKEPDNEEAILRSVKNWMYTDLEGMRADRLYYHCRDRRAYL